METEQSSSDSEEPFVCSLGPKRLFPSVVSDILFGKPNRPAPVCEPPTAGLRQSRDSHDMDSEDSEIDNVCLQHEKEMGGKEASSSVSIVPGDILGEADVSTSKSTHGQYFTAEQACCFLQESNYETSGDEISEVTEISASSSDSVFDLSNPDAGMEEFSYGSSDCVSSTDTGEQLSDRELPHNYVSSTATDRMAKINVVREAYLHDSSDSSSSSEEKGKSAGKRRKQDKALSRSKVPASKSHKANTSKPTSKSCKASAKKTEPDHELSAHDISDTDYEYCFNDTIPFSPRCMKLHTITCQQSSPKVSSKALYHYALGHTYITWHYLPTTSSTCLCRSKFVCKQLVSLTCM